MNPDQMDEAELLADESFLNYCRRSSAEDVVFWEARIKESPEKRDVIENARKKYIELFNALAQADLDEQEARLKDRLHSLGSAPVWQMEGMKTKRTRKLVPLLLKLSAAAAVTAIIFFTTRYYSTGERKSLRTFVAAYGERKNIQLPDGSDVTLNAGSKIQINESFGAANRDVFLDGEAFFDVKHNEKLPFIVHTPAMDVKALGTAFDVNAYLNEKITEISLIRGVVEVTLKAGNNRKMLLYPNQKIKWEPLLDKAANVNSSGAKKEDSIDVTSSLMRTLVPTDDGDIKEIAWKDNKLIFENELLGDIAILLERWYGAKLRFEDDSIRNYRFTGIFEKEDLSTVLNILKESRSFNYKIEPGETLTIKLSK